MNRIIPLSLIAATSIYAAEIELAPIDIQSTVITEVSQKAQKSVDLAQALSTSVPSIDMNRRSAIANDIYIRGQKRDNISIEVDGTKVCGACPNRMDPPVSHILASQIDEVEVIEGPYDVTTFGSMSGGVKIKTKKPSKKLQGEVNLGFGQWDYNKVGATVSGGNDIVRVLVSGTYERSGQYEDGDGNTMAEQVKKNAAIYPELKGTQYKPEYEDMDAYTKRSVMAKAFINITQDQELRLSYTANRSDDILYPNSKMDALWDDSNIYSVEYNVKDLADTYKNLNLQYYKSDVDHPMGTNYRMASAPKDEDGNPLPPKVMVNWLTTDMQGIKIKNRFDIASYNLTVGLDGSERKWDGHYELNGKSVAMPFPEGRKSIDDSVTTNMAIFAQLAKSYGSFDFSMGARFDSTEITHATLDTNDYTGINVNLMTSYNLDKENKFFIGIGQANRVPDARELSFTGSMGNLMGTPDLEQVTNQEIDLGFEANTEHFKLKIKAFYSMLSDYIYIQKGVSTNAFQNIDATIYGTELALSYYATDDMTIDAAMSHKVGHKDKALEGQTDKDLADIAPLRGNVALNYEYMNDSIATVELQASEKWSKYDSDNGEQELAGWGIVNLKAKHAFNKNLHLTLGLNNVGNKTYAKSNTYVDLILLTSGTGDVMLLNEPGRYFYTNIDIKF